MLKGLSVIQWAAETVQDCKNSGLGAFWRLACRPKRDRTLEVLGHFISKDLTAVSLTGALEGQAAAKGCIPGETVALQVLASCPTFLCELCDPPRGTLCGQFTAPPEQSWVLLRSRWRGPSQLLFQWAAGRRTSKEFIREGFRKLLPTSEAL